MKLTLLPAANKQLKKIPRQDQIKILRKLTLLRKEPLAGKILMGELSDYRSLRAWPYRIIYQIIRHHIVIISISHRQGVYK